MLTCTIRKHDPYTTSKALSLSVLLGILLASLSPVFAQAPDRPTGFMPSLRPQEEAPGYDWGLDWDQEARLLMHIAWLANDAREGRGIGTMGLDSSAAYIARNFEQLGLLPLFEDSWYQPFDMSWGIQINDNTRLITGDDTLTVDVDILPAGFTGNGNITAPVVFAGYGISAPEYDYDDYAEIDVQDKIVVILEGEPAGDQPGSRMEGTNSTPHSTLRAKTTNAKMKGAAGVLIVAGPNRENAEVNELPILRTNEPYMDAGLPVLHITGRGLETISGGRFNLENAQRSIDLNQTPRSMDVTTDEITVSVEVQRDRVPVKNVGAILPGASNRLLIVGAHYDHLGYGQMGSTEPGVHAVHNGADDNASGVAVILELARYFRRNPAGPTIWFVAFTAEETGLVGSSYFVDNPPPRFEEAFFMLNIDMVGRVENNTLAVLGIHSAEELTELAERATAGSGLAIAGSGGGYGPSDHSSFYRKGIPVVQYMGSAHPDYHSSRDDTDMIHSRALVRVLAYGRNFIQELSDPELTLTYVEETPPEQGRGRHGIPVSLGTVPDFAQPDSLRGFRIQAVRPGTPAAEAGLQGGDILIRMDEVIMDNIYDFTYALRQHQPGDEVVIVFVRNGEEHETTAVLGEPSRRGHGGGGHPGGQ